MSHESDKSRVSVTLRERDTVRLSSASGEVSEVLVTRISGGRVRLSVEALRTTRIERVPQEDPPG